MLSFTRNFEKVHEFKMKISVKRSIERQTDDVIAIQTMAIGGAIDVPLEITISYTFKNVYYSANI